MEMTLQRFLIYAGVLLLAALLFTIISSQLSRPEGIRGKAIFWYGFFAALVTGLAAFLIPFITPDPFWMFWLFGALYLLAGMVHNRYAGRHLRHPARPVDFAGLLAASVIGVAIVCFSMLLFSGLYFFLRDRYFLFYPVLMGTLLFFLPLLVWHSFLAAYAIPQTKYPTWVYPLHNPPEYPADATRERMLVVGLELLKNDDGRKKTYFRAKVPETMRLGDFFYHFIADYNDLHQQTPIAYVNAQFEPSHWLFHTRVRWYQSTRMLNPAYTIRENNIRENTVIVCERRTAVAQSVSIPKKQLS